MTLRKISLTSQDRNTARLEIDDYDVSSQVAGLHLAVDPRTHEHRMVLDVVAFPVEIAMDEVHVRIDEPTHDFLVWLGWTPPPHEEDKG